MYSSETNPRRVCWFHLANLQIGPAELLFGGALTGMIFWWKLTLSIDLGTTGRGRLRDNRLQAIAPTGKLSMT